MSDASIWPGETDGLRVGAGEGEGRAVTSGQDAGQHSERPHRDRNQGARSGLLDLDGQGQQARHVRDRVGGDRDLHHVGALSDHGRVEAVEALRGALEVVEGDDEPAAGLGGHEVGQAAAVLDVHVVEPPPDRFEQQARPARVGVVHRPPFRARAAGEEKGQGAGPQDGQGSDVPDEVGSHLEHVRHGARLSMRSMSADVPSAGERHADPVKLDSRKSKSLFRIP